MPELPSLLRQRLQAGDNARLQHPDADSLTAYVEQLLPAAERKLVLEHIAVCGDCREIVFLATPDDAVVAGPEAVAPEVVAVPSPRRRWFLTPGFGLAASIAAMAVAVTLVIELPHKSQPFTAPAAVADRTSNAQAGKVQAPIAAAKDSATPPVQNAATASNAPTTNENADANLRASNAPPTTAPVLTPPSAVPLERSRSMAASAGAATQKAGVGGTLNQNTGNQIAANQNAGAQNAKARESHQQLRPEILAQVAEAKGDQLSETVQVMPAPPLQTGAAQQDYLNAQRFATDAGNSVAAQTNLPSAPAPSLNANGAKQSTMLAGNWQQSNSYLVVPETQQTKQGGLTFTPPPPEHQSLLSKIVEVGKRPIKRAEPSIQAGNVRSFAMFDKNVAPQKSDMVAARTTAESTDTSNLASSPAFTSRGFGASRKSFLGSASIYRWKVLQGKLLKSADAAIWLEAYSSTDGIEFSTVHSMGSEIWAGGNHGQLVHSRDGGTTWEKVTIGDATVGNVVSIENSGLNVHVVTAPSQGWSSTDGGKTWIKIPQ